MSIFWLLVANASQARLFQRTSSCELCLLQSWQGKPVVGQVALENLRRSQQRFPKKLAEWLNQRRQEFACLGLVASPRMAADLKEFLHPELRPRIHTEIHEDWSTVEAHDLPGRLLGAR